MNLITCPCCGFQSITGEYDICQICGWEHDLAQESQPDDANGPNFVSLRIAQQNFVRLGYSERPLRSSIDLSKFAKDRHWSPLKD